MIQFPNYTGTRCLMMPYIQGDAGSVPEEYQSYVDILNSTYIHKGDIGYLTIDESPVKVGQPHRGARAKYPRALHTEAGKRPGAMLGRWGGGGWGHTDNVVLRRNTQILVASNLGNSCCVWDAEQEDTSLDGDIGYLADKYPYEAGRFLQAGELATLGIFTPHESIPVQQDFNRQFIRIVGSGVSGREPYFTINPTFRK